MLSSSDRTLTWRTTLLIDEQGIIRWIDQSNDDRLRSAPQRVLAAIRDLTASSRRAVRR